MASSSCAALVSPHRRSGAHGSRGSGGMRRLEVSARSAGGRGAGRGGGRGAPGGRAPQQQQQQRTDGQGASKPKPPKLPEYGYFSQADTKGTHPSCSGLPSPSPFPQFPSSSVFMLLPTALSLSSRNPTFCSASLDPAESEPLVDLLCRLLIVRPRLPCCLRAAPVYAPLAGRESGDFTKRGGRWNPEFIWNTNWVEQVRPVPGLGRG